MDTEIPLALDLFAGAGGSSRGLMNAGYRVVAAVDNDPRAAETLRANCPEVLIVESDIELVDETELRATLKLEKGELDLLNACPPCQGWSTLGKSDHDDARNQLITQLFRFVQEFRPKAVILENVPGLRSDERLVRLKRRLRRLGYRAAEYAVDATEFGVPQRRKRFILLAVRSVYARKLTCHLTDYLPSSFSRVYPTVSEVFSQLPPIGQSEDPMHIARRSTPTVLERIRAIPPGGTRFDLPGELRLECHNRLEGKRATAAYGRIDGAGPAPTMTTRCTTPACGKFIHPKEDRGLSLREAALLQTFPSKYYFSGNYADIERQIGNAVPVRMAEGLGLAVISILSSSGADT